MANTQIKTRIIHKHDTAANWELAVNFIPKQGEIIIYDKDSTYNYERFKIGDGATLVSALPFANDALKAEIQTLLNGKASTSSVTQLSNKVDGKVDKDGNKVLSTNDYTTAEKNKLAGIASGAEVNQNAFGNVVVGSTTIAADSKTDTLTFVAGTNITLTPDATNDKITITAKDTTYSNATTSAAGLMSADDKTKLNAAVNKLDGIAEGANKTVVDTALSSSSTNPVQNKVINSALSGKQATITGAATTITSSNLTTDKALISNSSGKVAVSSVSSTELGYLSGVTSSIQEQLTNLNNEIDDLGENKVDKVSGKGLSSNDFTSDYITKINNATTKLSGIADGANKTTVDSSLSSTSTNPVQNKVINSALSGKVDKVDGKGLSTNDFTTTLKNKLDGIASGAQVNQNAFSNITDGTTTIAADSTTDTLTLAAGSNISLALDATNDKVTISATNTTYSAAGSSLGLVKSGGDVTISSGVITVNDDSHNHTIDNVDDLKNTLDAKISAGELTVTTSGSGNAITSASYDSDTRTITLTKGASYNNYTYTLPAAGSSLGGVKTGGDVTISSGVITVNDDSHNHVISNVDGLQNALDSKASKSDYETFKTNVNTLLDSDDTTLDQMSEIVAYTKNNKGLIDSITTAKQDKITGAATTITSSNLTAGRVLISDSNGKVAATSGITTTQLSYLSGVTSEIQNQLDSKLSKTDNISEANLVWGGKNFTGKYGPIDAAMIPTLGADRLAFGKPAGVIVEYSTDSGTTWLDYGATDEQKNKLFSSGSVFPNFIIGKNSTKSETIELKNYLLRVTIDTDSFQVYTTLNKFAIYVSTSGSTGCYCTIDASLESTPTTFETFANQVPINGWSGWNIINTSGITTYGNTAASQYGKIRFTFGCTGGTAKNYTGLTLLTIMGFGGMGHTTPSYMAKLGHLYTWDSSQNAFFPAKVTATGGFSGSLTGNATSATKATQDASGNVITSTYATKTELGNKVDKVSGKGLSTNDFTTTLKNKLDSIAEGANNYSLPTASSSTKGGVKTGAAITDTTGYTAVHIKDGVIYYKDTNTNLVTSVFGKTGDVTLTKNDVTTALGYTPPTTNTTYTAGTGLSLSNGAFSVKTGYTTSGKNYKVQADSNGNLYVNVPWTDSTPVTSVFGRTGAVTLSKSDVTTALGYTPPTSNTTYSAATYSTLGLVKPAYTSTGAASLTTAAATNTTTPTIAAKTTTAGRYYAVEADKNGVLFVNVPWSDTNTQTVTSVFGRTGAVTLTKSDVTTALGYTPPTSDTNTHYTTRLYAGASGTAANAAATNPYLKVTDDNTYRNQIRFVGSGATTVSSDANGNITISSTDTNTHAVTSVFGRTGAVTLTKSDVTTALGYTPPTTDTNTTYSTATSSTLGLVKIGYTQSGKNYPVQLSNGQMYVNVPWTDTNTTYTLSSFGITATSTELNYCDGVTSNIQTQINNCFSASVSRTANHVLAAPNGSNGNASFRALVAADIPSLNVSKLTAGTLGTARGGTGITSNPSMLVNLGSTSAASVFAASPRPGITGTLGIGNGGTGATSKSGARTNLGITSGTSLPASATAGDIFFLYT